MRRKAKVKKKTTTKYGMGGKKAKKYGTGGKKKK